jgi:hypothetical protein
MQLELRAKEVHVAIEKSNLKLLEAVSARSLSFLKGFGDKEQAETNKDKSEYSGFSSDPPAKLDPGTKVGRPITHDWLDSEATPFEKTILNQIQELVANPNLSQEIILPALGSILDMRQLEEFKRNVSASGTANIIALLSLTGMHVCTKQGYSLKSSIFNFLSSSGASCVCPEIVGTQMATASHNIENLRNEMVGSKKQSGQSPHFVQRSTRTRAAPLNKKKNDPSEDPSSSSSSSPAPSDPENEQDDWPIQDKPKSRTRKQDPEDYKQRHREIQAVRSEYPKEKRFNGSL